MLATFGYFPKFRGQIGEGGLDLRCQSLPQDFAMLSFCGTAVPRSAPLQPRDQFIVKITNM